MDPRTTMFKLEKKLSGAKTEDGIDMLSRKLRQVRKGFFRRRRSKMRNLRGWS